MSKPYNVTIISATDEEDAKVLINGQEIPIEAYACFMDRENELIQYAAQLKEELRK